MTTFRNQRCSARIMPSTETPLDGSLVWWDEDIRAFWGFVSSCEWVVASLPWRRGGPHRRGVVGLTARRRRRSVHRLAKTAPRRRFGAFVYTVAPREDRANDRGNAGVYTDWLKRPLGAVLGHLCTLLTREGHASCVVACGRYAIVPVASLGECRLLDNERVAAGVARQKRRDRAEQRILDR